MDGVRYDPARHRLALACALATIVLLAAGGLVTSTGSGLAVPDWPLSFGTLFPPMAGGVLYEHGHRLVAAAVGLLTLLLAAWFLVTEPRPGVRRLALGGLTVLLRLPASVSVAHACLAQGFFCVAVTLALATSRGFVAVAPRPLASDGAVPLFIVAATATGLVYAQLILGAVMRHTGAGLAIPDLPLAFGRLVPPLLSFEIAVHFAHRVGAVVVLGAVGWMAARALPARRDHPELARPAVLAIILVAVQILLGGITVASRLAVLPATAHVVVGALLLAACLVTALRAARVRVRAPRRGRLAAAQPRGQAA